VVLHQEDASAPHPTGLLLGGGADAGTLPMRIAEEIHERVHDHRLGDRLDEKAVERRRSASSRTSSRPNAVTRTIAGRAVNGTSPLMRRLASRPSRSGMRQSMKTRSYGAIVSICLMAAMASGPEATTST